MLTDPEATALSAADYDALSRAIETCRQKDPAARAQIERKLATELWRETAEFAAYSCQCDALHWHRGRTHRVMSTTWWAQSTLATMASSATMRRQSFCSSCSIAGCHATSRIRLARSSKRRASALRKLNPVDREALKRAIEIARSDPEERKVIDRLMEKEGWFAAAQQAVYHCQRELIRPRLWQPIPSDIDDIEGTLAKGDDGLGGSYR